MPTSSFVHVHLIALRYFGETVRTGSMRQAAEQLHVAASAVNRQILKLEDQLQCKLFDRTAEGVRLTAAGEVLYHYILRLEHDLERAISQIDDLRGLRRGHVRIACEDGIGRDFLPPVLAGFHREFPRVTFSVEIASALDIMQQVAEGLTDIGISMTPPLNADVAVQASAAMPIGVIASRDSWVASRHSIRMREIGNEPIIEAKDGTGGGTDFYAQLGNGLNHTRFVETNAPDFITNLVQAGLGVGFRTSVGILRDIEDGRIAFVPLAEESVKSPVLAIYIKPHRTMPIAGAVLLERLKESLPAFQARVAAVGSSAARATQERVTA